MINPISTIFFAFTLAAMGLVYAASEIDMPSSFDLGLLGGAVSGAVITLDIKNSDLWEEFKIESIKGACVCFKGFSGEKIIKPNSTGEIELNFDLSRFVNEGHWKSSLIVQGSFKGTEILKQIQLSAKFDRNGYHEDIMIPARGNFVYQVETRDADKTSFEIYAPSDLAESVKVEVGENSPLYEIFLDSNVEYLPQFGSFSRIAKVDLRVKEMPSLSRRTVHIPVMLSGGISKTVIWDCEITATK